MALPGAVKTFTLSVLEAADPAPRCIVKNAPGRGGCRCNRRRRRLHAVGGAPGGRPCEAAPGAEHMSQKTCLAAALAIGVGLMAAGAALAQAQPGSAAPPAASAQPAPPPAQSTAPWDQADPATIKPWD